MSQLVRVVQAFDRTLIKEIPADDAEALEAKIVTATRALRERDAWLKPYQRSAILLRAASLLEGRQQEFAKLIAREGGKPLTDALVEAVRAVDGLRNAAEESAISQGVRFRWVSRRQAMSAGLSPQRSPSGSSRQYLPLITRSI